MFKQKELELFAEASLKHLWEQFPEAARAEVTAHYARLMAHTTVQRIRALREHNKEVGNEPQRPE